MTPPSGWTSSRTDQIVFVLRVVAGVVFAIHGWQKVFALGIPAIVAGFTKYGAPLPTISAPLVSLLELVGGLAIALGFLTRIFAGLLMIEMLGAITFVHFRNGFFLPTGYEYALMLATVMLTLVLGGPGKFSLGAKLSRRRQPIVGRRFV